MTTDILHKGVRLDVPLVRRRLDYLLVPSLVAGIAYSASFSLPEALGVRVRPVASVVNMYFYFMQTFLGPDRPPHLGTYLPLDIPWLIIPILVAYRFWPQRSARSGPGATGDDPSDDNGTPQQQVGSR